MTGKQSLDDARSFARAKMSDEMWRILVAVDEGRLSMNKNGRYVIDREERPDRRSRENLVKRGLIDWKWTTERGTAYYVTDKGRAALEAAGFGVRS